MCEHFPGLSVQINPEFDDEFWPLVLKRSNDVNICFVALIENLHKRMSEALANGKDDETSKLVNLNIILLIKYLYPIMEQINETTCRHVVFDLFDEPVKEND